MLLLLWRRTRAVNKTLSLRCLGPELLLTFFLESLSDNILVDIISFSKTEKLSDSVSSFGPWPLKHRLICQSRNIPFSPFHTNQGESPPIVIHNEFLRFLSPVPAWSIRMLLTHQQAHSAMSQGALLHGKTLLVIPTIDSDHTEPFHSSPRASSATSVTTSFSQKVQSLPSLPTSMSFWQLVTGKKIVSYILLRRHDKKRKGKRALLDFQWGIFQLCDPQMSHLVLHGGLNKNGPHGEWHQ